MKQTKRLEIIGVLSLSLLITSAFAVSSCTPEMLKTFTDYDLAAVELLMSAPSFTMLLMIALTPIFSKFLSERFMVIAGLTTFGISGLIPVFIESYPVIFTSRIIMGIGIGLLNAKAVSMIGERFTGDLRSKLQGLRCSMETLGQAALMLAVGFILPYGWNYAFLVYGFAFVILIMYLAFVPTRKPDAEMVTNSVGETDTETYKLTMRDWIAVFKNFFLGLSLVAGQMIISLRVTSYIVEYGIGTSVDGANLLSIATFFGFIGGLLFGKLLAVFKQNLLPLALLITSCGMLTIATADQLLWVTIGSCLCNLSLILGFSFMFNRLSEQVPVKALNTANSLVLVGCNLGASITPFVLNLISQINPTLRFGYYIYAAAFLLLAVGSFISGNRKS